MRISFGAVSAPQVDARSTPCVSVYFRLECPAPLQSERIVLERKMTESQGETTRNHCAFGIQYYCGSIAVANATLRIVRYTSWTWAVSTSDTRANKTITAELHRAGPEKVHLDAQTIFAAIYACLVADLTLREGSPIPRALEKGVAGETERHQLPRAPEVCPRSPPTGHDDDVVIPARATRQAEVIGKVKSNA